MRLDVQFNPFTYEELIRPIADYNEAYNALADSYATLSDQTEAFRNEVNATDSRKAYEQFNRYAEDLGAAIDDFSKGMTSSNRASLLNMKRRYGREIGTIAKAAEARKAAENFRAEISATNPNAVFEVDHYISLDPFLEGKQANNEYWNGTAAFNRLSAKAEALGKALFSNPDYELYLEDGQQYKISQLNGISPEELMIVLSRPENINTEAGREMRKILEEELGNVDLYKYSTQGRQKINNILNTAMYAGLAKPTYDFVANGEYISKADRKSLEYDKERVDLAKTQYDDDKKAENIATGKEPYLTDSDGTKYYSNGTALWSVDKDGKTSPITYLKKRYNADGETIGEPKKENKETPKFILQDFTSDIFNDLTISDHSDTFSTDDAELINFDALRSHQKTQLVVYLSKKGLTSNDVDIYKDQDWPSNNHYRVVRKGYNVYGQPTTSKTNVSTNNGGNKQSNSSSTPADSTHIQTVEDLYEEDNAGID